MKRLMLALSLLASVPVHADTVHLKSGGKLSGIVVSQNERAVEVEIGAGRVTMPMRLVERIDRGESSLSRYQARAHALDSSDVAGWLDLAEWARGAELSSQAREAYEHVLSVDPGNAAAHRGLEHHQVGGQWLTRDDAMAARGYVLFEGRWVMPAERDAALAQQDADRRDRIETESARLALAAAEARAREAEARARTAEAEAERGPEPPPVIILAPNPGRPYYGNQPHIPEHDIAWAPDPPHGRHGHSKARQADPTPTPSPSPTPKDIHLEPAGVAKIVP